MKRFLVALAIMIGALFVFSLGNSSTIDEYKYEYKPISKVLVINNELETIRFGKNENDITPYIRNNMDFLCEVDSVKYYLY